MGIEVIAKTAPVSSQIESRLAAGFDMFEVQLLDIGFSLANTYKILAEYGSQIDIRSIHTALMPDGSDITLSDIMFDSRARDSFYRTCELASKCAAAHPVIVVIHNDISRSYLDSHAEFLNILITTLKKAFAYSNIRIGIENTTAISSHKGHISFRSGVEPMDTPGVVRCLRNLFGDELFGYVFDIGHYAIMRKLVRFLADSFVREYVDNPTLEEIWKSCEDIMCVIHLSAIQGFGYGIDHGKPFYEWEPRDREFIRRILTLYENMTRKPEFVVEVKESDYDNCWNLEHTSNTIETVLNEMHPVSLLEGTVNAERVFVYPDSNRPATGPHYIAAKSVVLDD